MSGQTTLGPTVLKFGGELLETPDSVAALARLVAEIGAVQPLIVVHGGGKEIDAALARAGIAKQQVDGLRITDEPTLEIVVSVVAGTINTRLVAAIGAAGGGAVGLTGADAGLGLSELAPPHHAIDGRLVSLGLVGQPSLIGEARVLTCLVAGGFIPVIACIGVDARGHLLNVNADTLAAAVSARTRASRLVIAGTTPGVLDQAGHTIPILTADRARALTEGGAITAGMLAKLHACRTARDAGVPHVSIVDGRGACALYAHLLREAGDPGADATQVT